MSEGEMLEKGSRDQVAGCIGIAIALTITALGLGTGLAYYLL